MRTRWGQAVLTMAPLILAGCASYQPRPLTATHPAHPDAAPARAAPASQTLAYTRADTDAVRAAPPAARAEPGEQQARPSDAKPTKTVLGEGEVISTVPTSGQIVVDHGEIKGFMDAMTMGYRTDPPSLLATVKAGDKIRFTIDVDRRAIVHIEKLN